MPYIRVKELPPVLQRVLAQAGYRSPDIEVEVSEAERPFHGSGAGKRAFVAPVNLLTGQYEIHWGSWGGPNMFTAPTPPDDPHAPPIPIPPNGVLITGVSGPKTYATIYVSPATTAPLLPAAPTLTTEELVAIFCIQHRRSGEPRRECLQEFGVRPATVDRLVTTQLLKRDARGAMQVTTAGKNALAQGQGKVWGGYEPPYEWRQAHWDTKLAQRPDNYFGDFLW